ncbi:hypothetical protein P691DRAFT_677258 [Macrolepiota fuliginosa MF-IS2]|uniref:C3H1-type domain-containing protein n=1 Tax=Macrolepiota fuliginosa MF-IS2 TaxID=1400762 RepID=A0A9P5X7M5_9AGAR|nr:hypothetical protein P691DRAFT_677258 [Macrolepiota fuliginosa MF-IS2]
MPTADVVAQVETDRDREKERERDRESDRHERGEKSGGKQKATSASTKAKDLSHVPCKFFKVGACTAGASCPFSHASAEPGAQKEPCAWFIKGNCKFGHKCALAHVLPGQSMTMDRKNKKAAQQAAAASGAAEKASGKDSRKKRDGQGSQSNTAPGRNNTLLAGGSTAPTRLLSSNSSIPASNRPPMPLKASISPSAPAPPLKDTEFASFAALDEMEGVQLSAPPAQGKSQAQEVDASADSVKHGQGQSQSTPSPVPLPTSAPRVTAPMAPSEFGPIGSPPSANRAQLSATGLNGGTLTPGTSPRGHSHLNGVNLGTSPQTGHGFLSSSPFSAPGTQSVFMNNSYVGHGVAASLGSGLAMMGGRRGWGEDISASPAKGGLSMLASSVQRSSLLNGNTRGEYGIDVEYEDYGRGRKNDSAVEDGDMEDFIPGSLTDLLTPEERSRRMSRSGNNLKPPASALTAGAPASGDSATPAPTSGNRLGHRYSSSVPAPSLLGDIKSIWSDTSVGLSGSPSAQQSHRATPSASFVPRFEGLTVGGQQGANDDMGLSMSMGSAGAGSSLGMMSPSNASAAFLPGLHHNYLKAKASQQAQLGLGGGTGGNGSGGGSGGGAGGGGLSRGLRGSSNPLFPPGTTTTPKNLSTNYLPGMAGTTQGFPSSANNPSALAQLPSYRGAPSPFDLTQPMHQAHNHASRPIPTSDTKRVEGEIVTGQFLSPNTRALQAHAPGQSLPQGLAAGYSRIHALPPLTNLASPGVVSGGAFPPAGVVDNTAGQGVGATLASGMGYNSGVPGASPGLESVLSKLSYSAAAKGGAVSSSPTPPGLLKSGGTGRFGHSGHGGASLSSVSSPLGLGDGDDELFAMDK